MTLSVSNQAAKQLVTLMPPAGFAVRAGMCLIYDNQPGTGSEELIATAVCLYKVRGNDDVREYFEERLTHAAMPFKAVCSAWQNKFGFDVKLSFQFTCHCSAKAGGQRT